MNAPDSSAADLDPLDALADEFIARVRAGEPPDIADFAARYPELATRIRRLFPTLLALEKLAPPEPALGRPAHLGEYRIIREIGRGGMGIVYEAVQESLGRHVALKVLAPGAGGLHPERFRREARVAAGLHHTNIVPVFGVGADGDTLYYAMQFIRGQPLSAVLREVRALRERSTALDAAPITLPATEPLLQPAAPRANESGANLAWAGQTRSDYCRHAARLALQAAEALAYAHGQGVVHRDVKPANLLLDPAGNLWLSDFGLAKDEIADDLTASGDIVGTLRYMAPERFRGEATTAGDIYALGATLYELLALRPPFDAPERAGLVKLIEEGRPTPLRQLDPGVPRDLETVAHKALAASPRDRYASAAELAADLRRFLADEPVRARPLSAAGHLWRWAKRNRAIAALVLALAISVLGGGIASGVGWWRADQRRRQAEFHERESAGSKRAMFAAVDRYFTRVSESRLLNEPGAEKLRAELLADARIFFERYARDHAADPDARREYAQALVRVAEMSERTESVDARHERWRQALAVWRTLVDQQPNDRDNLDWLGRALLGSADSANAAGHADELTAAATEAEAVYEQLTALPAESAEELNALASGWKSLGRTLHLRARYEPAVRAYRQALAAHDRLVALEPTDARRVQRAATRTFHWATSRHIGAAGELTPEMHATVAELRDALTRDPRSFQIRAILANALNAVANSAHGGDWATAEKLTAASVELRSRILDDFPNRADMRRELVRDADALGFMRVNLRLLPEADAAYALAERGYEALRASDPSNALVHEEHACHLSFWANVKLLLGRADEALALLDRAIDLLRPWVAAELRQELNRRHLGAMYSMRTWARAALPGGRPEAEAILRDLDEAARVGWAFQHRDFRARGTALARLGRFADAAKQADEMLTTRPRRPSNGYLAAGVWATIAREAAGPTWERRLLAEAAARRAVALLRQALDLGVFKDPPRRLDLRVEACHAVLHGRADFQQLERDVHASPLNPPGVRP